MKPAIGSHRIPDHSTSIAAAEKVAQRAKTIRQTVINFALAHPYGFIDDDLKAAFPDAPESSFRKRRTELSDENVIVERGDVRRNRAGQDETVWSHRDHMQFPPPLKAREIKPKRYQAMQDEIARLTAERDAARDRAERVQKALEPFAIRASTPGAEVLDDYAGVTFHMLYVRAAAAVLGERAHG